MNAIQSTSVLPLAKLRSASAGTTVMRNDAGGVANIFGMTWRNAASSSTTCPCSVGVRSLANGGVKRSIVLVSVGANS